jgi:hypothetical protein
MSDNPFLKIKARSFLGIIILIIPLTIVLSLLIGVFIGKLFFFENSSQELDLSDPLFLSIVTNICFYLSVSLWLFIQIKKSNLNLKLLLGKLPQNSSWFYLLIIAIPILLFSWGTGQIIYLVISWIKPELLTSLLDRQLFLTATETNYPLFYNTIQVISIIFAAPAIEEILFRGILFQRWATKWNLVAGTIVSSLVFGFLHFNIVGLFNFGVIMCILYLHTKTLYIPIFVHILNNSIAIGIELITSISKVEKTAYTVEQLQSLWWEPIIIIAIALPWLIYFVLYYWQGNRRTLPYFVNRNYMTTQSSNELT